MNYKSLLQPRTTTVAQDASFTRRFLSFLIDIMILDIVITEPFTPIFASFVARTKDLSHITYTHTELTAVIMLFMIVYLYFVLFEYFLGQTIGMMLVNTKLEGNSGMLTVLIRNSFILPVFPFIALWIIEPITVLFRRKTFLEQITKTRTVYERQLVW